MNLKIVITLPNINFESLKGLQSYEERIQWDKSRMIDPKLIERVDGEHIKYYFKGPVPPIPLVA